MEMTKNEICRNYREAKYPKQQIGILAVLNDCSKREIQNILMEAGLIKKREVRFSGIELSETDYNSIQRYKKLTDEELYDYVIWHLNSLRIILMAKEFKKLPCKDRKEQIKKQAAAKHKYPESVREEYRPLWYEIEPIIKSYLLEEWDLTDKEEQE